jgi:hypothetical protein
MKLSTIAALAALLAAGLWGQKATNPLEDHTSYDAYSKDSENRKRQEALKSIGHMNPQERLEQAFADLKALDGQIEKLNQLNAELRTGIAGSDPKILTRAQLKRVDELEKLAKDIRVRVRRAAVVAQVE